MTCVGKKNGCVFAGAEHTNCHIEPNQKPDKCECEALGGVNPYCKVHNNFSVTRLTTPTKPDTTLRVPEDHWQCSRCKEIKPNSEYYKSKSQIRGYYYMCIPCWRERAKEYRDTEQGKEKERIKARRMSRKHLQASRARAKAKHAIKIGTIVKPEECEDCGTKAELAAHHEDYSKPLDVVFVCSDCHRKRHGRYKAPARSTT